MIDRLKSLRPGHIKLVVVAILKSLRTSHVLLASVAIVIAIEGGFISWSLYGVREDVEVAKEAMYRELLSLRGYATTNQELTIATNKFLETANKELVEIKSDGADTQAATTEAAKKLELIRNHAQRSYQYLTVIESNTRGTNSILGDIDDNTNALEDYTRNTSMYSIYNHGELEWIRFYHCLERRLEVYSSSDCSLRNPYSLISD